MGLRRNPAAAPSGCDHGAVGYANDAPWPPAVVIPAHDEARVIGRLLDRLLAADGHPDLEIIVVCNGCRDSTADVVLSYGSRVRLLETPVASKIAALRMGDAAAHGFPRLFVDADVEIDRESVRALVQALGQGDVLAVGPRRVIPFAGVSRAVRAYYSAWQELPASRTSLWGRGVIGLSERAHPRIAAMPDALSDDLALSLLFAPHERRIVDDAVVVVHPPRSLGALLARGQRSVTGNRMLAETGMAVDSDRTRLRDLGRIAITSPEHALGVGVLAAVAVTARAFDHRARRSGAAIGWARDDTSRATGNVA